MTFTKRITWVLLTTAYASLAFAQSEPYYIPNTLPSSSSTESAPVSSPAPMMESSSSPVPMAEPNISQPSISPSVNQSSEGSPIYTYAQGGTQGLGIGIGMKVNPSWVIRAEVNGLNFNRDFTKAGNSYSGKAKLRSEGVYADYYPMENTPFRVTGGLLFNQSKLTGTTNSGSSVVLNGTTYTLASGEVVTATVKSPSVLPYLGIGYGHDEADKMGIKFHADLGFAFGSKPSATVSLPNSLAANTAADANRRAEEQKLEDSFKTTPFVGKIQPVAEIGIGYTW